jgi:hypothetical protein
MDGKIQESEPLSFAPPQPVVGFSFAPPQLVAAKKVPHNFKKKLNRSSNNFETPQALTISSRTSPATGNTVVAVLPSEYCPLRSSFQFSLQECILYTLYSAVVQY